MKLTGLLLTWGVLTAPIAANCQAPDTVAHSAVPVASRSIEKMGNRYSGYDAELVGQTDRYLGRLDALEGRIRAAAAASGVTPPPPASYGQWTEKLQAPLNPAATNKVYVGRLDTLRMTFNYLQVLAAQHGGMPGTGGETLDKAGGTLSKAGMAVGSLQAHLDASAQISEYVSERRQELSRWLTANPSIPGVPAVLNKYKAEAYYFRQRMEQFKATLSDPHKIEQQAITRLSSMPAYQQFISRHSMLASLFRLPSGDSAQAMQGLQTKEQIQGMLHQAGSGGNSSGQASIDQQMQQAKQQLTAMQNGLSKYGIGGQDVDMPDFKPNGQKTKTFLKRIVYGVSLQLSKSTDYFPATASMGITVGYKINDRSTAGIGASYNVGLGSDWSHLQFSSQGAGLRSFMDWKIKKTWYMAGGYELNEVTPFNSLGQLRNAKLWQPSLLIGLEKKYRISSKLQGNIQLLYDALYRQEIPAGQMFKFRVGYNF